MMRSKSEEAELTDVATRVAGAYHRRCSWVGFAEFYQEAWLAILEAERTFNLANGTPLSAYVWQAAINKCGDLASASKVPISASRKMRRRGVLHEVTVASLTPAPDREERVLPEELVTHAGRPDHQLADLEWNRATVTRMLELLGGLGQEAAPPNELHGVRYTRPALATLATEAIFGDEEQGEIAQRHGCHVWRVNRAVKVARRALSEDVQLHSLWKAQRA